MVGTDSLDGVVISMTNWTDLGVYWLHRLYINVGEEEAVVRLSKDSRVDDVSAVCLWKEEATAHEPKI